MSNKKNRNRKRRERMLIHSNIKKTISNNAKNNTRIKIEGNEPVKKKELFEIQKTIFIKLDTALMSTAALAEVLINKGICTWEEFKISEKKMLETLHFIRKTMAEASIQFGDKIDKEDLSAILFEKATIFGVDKGVLEGIFGIKKSESRIIRPSQVQVIKT